MAINIILLRQIEFIIIRSILLNKYRIKIMEDYWGILLVVEACKDIVVFSKKAPICDWNYCSVSCVPSRERKRG